jgi:hypothetical protein
VQIKLFRYFSPDHKLTTRVIPHKRSLAKAEYSPHNVSYFILVPQIWKKKKKLKYFFGCQNYEEKKNKRNKLKYILDVKIMRTF